MIKVLRALMATLMALAIVTGGAHLATADNTGTKGYRVEIIEQGHSVYGHLADAPRTTGFPTALMAIIDDKGQQIALTYCIDIRTPASTKPNLGYVETDASKLPDGIALTHQIRWILANSFPVKSLSELGETSGLQVSRKDAITATQAAIWKFANGFELDRISDGARPLYDWLVKQAAAAPDTKDPGNVTLSIKGENKVDAGRLGPIVISGNTATVELTHIDGGDLVDADGKAVNAAAVPVGKPLFVKVSGDSGRVNISVKGSITLTAGRAFVALLVKSQTLVTASQVVRSDSASATFEWTKPVEKLPTPTVSTEVSKQKVRVGEKISDTIIIEGFLTQHGNKAVTHVLTGKLYGPVAPLNNGGSLTCEGVNWTNAPVALSFEVKDVDTLRADAQGKLVIKDAGAYTVTAQGCYSYAETLVTTSGAQSNTVEHTVGKSSQTTLATQPVATATPIPTTTPTSTPTSEGTPTPEVTTTPVKTSTPTPSEGGVRSGMRPLADTGR